MKTDKLSRFINRIERLTKNPEKYLSLQKQEAEFIKLLTRDLYNFTKQNEDPSKTPTDALKELVVKNLDEEQIWQQVELQNNSVCNTLLSDVANLLVKKDSLQFPVQEKKKEKLEKLTKGEKKRKNVKEKVEVDFKDKKKAKAKKKLKHGKSSVVDDKFFKLHEMEEFLEKVERGEEDNENDEDDAEIDYFEDESFVLNDDPERQPHYNDFFDQPEEEGNSEGNDAFSDNSENLNEDDRTKKVKFMLKDDENKDVDFGDDEADDIGEGDDDDDYDDNDGDDDDYDDNDGDDDEEDDEDNDMLDGEEDEEKCMEDFDDDLNSEDAENLKNISKDDDEEEEEEEDDGDVDDSNDGMNDISKQPSTFEARQERLKTRIQNLEAEALREKPWQLMGEVTATNRPQNSLLEEYVEFDIATRPAPVLTEKSTLNLEDVIIQRIKDKAWDDVVRKIKPIESDIEYKKKLVLDQEKSKLSLAQIYEQEYLKQLDNKNEALDKPEVEPPEHQQIRIMMNKLFSKLDALSNFHFTPKQVTPEIKIVSNLPAISMEEVAPVAISAATLLAPEEVKPKLKGDLVGKTERTKTDKKRERRNKKLKQKIKYKQLEAKANLKPDKSDSKDKDKQKNKVSDKFLQKITKSSNVTQLQESEGGKYIKSSNAFFSKLQNEASSIIKKGLAGKNVKLDKKVSPKKKFKAR